MFPQDREACFKWFSKLMGEEPDLDPEINRDFFETNILQLDPSLMTESGIRCFDRFFKVRRSDKNTTDVFRYILTIYFFFILLHQAVNTKESKLICKRGRTFLMDDLELIGLDYIWRLVLCSNEDIANKAIDLLKDCLLYTSPSPRDS